MVVTGHMAPSMEVKSSGTRYPEPCKATASPPHLAGHDSHDSVAGH